MSLLLAGGWTRWSLNDPCNSNYSMIQWKSRGKKWLSVSCISLVKGLLGASCHCSLLNATGILVCFVTVQLLERVWMVWHEDAWPFLFVTVRDHITWISRVCLKSIKKPMQLHRFLSAEDTASSFFCQEMEENLEENADYLTLILGFPAWMLLQTSLLPSVQLVFLFPGAQCNPGVFAPWANVSNSVLV